MTFLYGQGAVNLLTALGINEQSRLYRATIDFQAGELVTVTTEGHLDLPDGSVELIRRKYWVVQREGLPQDFRLGEFAIQPSVVLGDDFGKGV